jgi:ferredoxin
MENKKCPKCNIEKPNTSEYFYLRVDRNGKTQAYCKECNLDNTAKRQQAFKQKLVEIKGGKCVMCGYCKNNAALHFHHIDPKEKDFGFSKFRATAFNKNKEKILQELDKCILVCANCHAEIHSRKV